MEDSHLIDGGMGAIGNSHAGVGLTWSYLGNVKVLSLLMEKSNLIDGKLCAIGNSPADGHIEAISHQFNLIDGGFSPY